MTDVSSITATGSGADASSVSGHAFSRYNASSSPDTGTASMSFDDFLDMVNPLQHIPLVSSIYRAVTGEQISPLARIAGDTLYGAAFGLASAGVSAIASIGDEVFAAANDGKSASQTVVAALFGSDDTGDSGTRLASATPSATPTPPDTQAATLQTPARQSPILQMPDLAASTTSTPAPTGATAATALAAASPSAAGTPFNLDRSKLPYGGVMDSAMMQNAMQNQSLALALASGQDNLQAQHALRNARFSTSTASPVTATTAQSASLPLPGDTPMLSGGVANPAQNMAAATAAPSATPTATASAAAQVTPGSLLQSLPGSMRQSMPKGAAGDLKMIKGLDQYRSIAGRMPAPAVGSAVNITN